MSTTDDVYDPNFDFGDPRPTWRPNPATQVEILDRKLGQARSWAARLADHQTDPEAVTAYRWLAERLSELRDDAATVGGLEP